MKKNIQQLIRRTTENFNHLKRTLAEIKAERQQESPRSFDLNEAPEAPRAETVTLRLSIGDVAKATIVVLGLWALSQFLAEVSHVILIFFISILFSCALNPTVDALERHKVPRGVSVFFMFLFLLFLLGFFISQLIPLVATQLIALAHSLTAVVEKVATGNLALPFGDRFTPLAQDLLQQLDRETVIAQVRASLEGAASQLQSVAGNTLGVIKSTFNGIFNFVMVLVLTFFFVTNNRAVHDFFISLFPSRHGAYIANKIDAIEQKIGFWLRGQVVLMLLMFSLSLVGLLILGIENAFTLAMMAGIAELLPVVGPLSAGLPVLLVAFNESPWLALWALGLIGLLQQIEGHILVPLVMRQAVGLSPIIIILAMLLGLETLGIVGMILAIPVATTLSIFVHEYTEKEK